MQELTGYQRDILYVAAAEPNQHGLGIHKQLEDYYEKDLNHGRTYTNLKQLANKGLIEKSAIDDRTNAYNITGIARQMLRDRTEWEYQHLNGMENTDV